MTSDIKYTLQTCTNFDDLRLNSFKVIMDDWSVTLFLTTSSIKSNLYLDVEPIGYINNVSVTDVQGLFDMLEASASSNERHQHYVDLLDDGLNESWDDLMMPYDEFLAQVNINKLPHRTRLKLFKLLAVSLDEQCWLDKQIALKLIKQYGYKTNNTLKRKNGFAKA